MKNIQQFILFLSLFLVSTTINAQISGGELKSPKKKKEKKEKIDKETFDASSLTGSSFYVSGLVMNSYRSFEDQSISKVYQQQTQETAKWTYGGNAGIILPFNQNIALDIGVTFFGFGEQFLFEDELTDSTFSYSNTYLQAGVPLKLRYTYGSNFQVFGYAGIVPSNILSLRTKTSYSDTTGIEIEPEITSTEQGFTAFHFMFTGGIGINYYFNEFGITFSPNYRRNFTNTYSRDVLKRQHNLYGFALNLGLTYRF